MLFALAFDHRNSLRRDFLGLTGAATASQVGLCQRLKALVFEGLVTAVGQGLAADEAATPAILVDEEYGAAVIARARERGVTVIVPVEASGQAELRFEHGDAGFGPAIERVDASYVKALVRYDPAAVELNRRQRLRLCALQSWLDDHGRDWILELLVPDAPASAEAVGPARAGIGGAAVGSAEAGPGGDAVGPAHAVARVGRAPRVVRAVEQLVDAGLRPAFWKLEGLPSTAAYAAVAAAFGQSGRADTGGLVLGRGADSVAVDRWVQLAAPVPAYRGFAVGRTLWWQPLRTFVADQSDRQVRATVEAVADNYLRLVDVYRGAMTHVG